MIDIKELINKWKSNEIEYGLYTSKNENGENVIIEVSKAYIKVTAIQENEWSRIHYYYDDGSVEELYER